MALLEEKEATWVEERVNFQAEIDILKAEAAEHQDNLAKLRVSHLNVSLLLSLYLNSHV